MTGFATTTTAISLAILAGFVALSVYRFGWRLSYSRYAAKWTIPPQPQTEPYETDIVEAVKRMLQSSAEKLTDEKALEVAALYPTWASKIGKSVLAGDKPDRLWYDGKLYKVIQPHTVQQEWTPDITPALYVEVSIEEWPEFVQPTGAHDAYNAGDKVTFEGKHYICQRDGCAYSPSEYPAAWQLVG